MNLPVNSINRLLFIGIQPAQGTDASTPQSPAGSIAISIQTTIGAAEYCGWPGAAVAIGGVRTRMYLPVISLNHSH
ncbi:MAG: hypothetical protein V4717_00765 [Bacteroidota bacterium]